jgi:hypothetical protein
MANQVVDPRLAEIARLGLNTVKNGCGTLSKFIALSIILYQI